MITHQTRLKKYKDTLASKVAELLSHEDPTANMTEKIKEKEEANTMKKLNEINFDEFEVPKAEKEEEEPKPTTKLNNENLKINVVTTNTKLTKTNKIKKKKQTSILISTVSMILKSPPSHNKKKNQTQNKNQKKN